MAVALMAGAHAFVVVVSMRFVSLIARVPVALFVRMPTSVLTMHVAGLKTLVFARGGTLLLARIVGASFTVAMLIIFVSATPTVTLHAARPVGPALLRKMVEFAIVSLLKLVAHFALCDGLNLFKLTVRNKAFAQVRVVDQVEVLCERLECLLAKFMTRADVLHPVALVEGHVKLLHRETRAGLLEVVLG